MKNMFSFIIAVVFILFPALVSAGQIPGPQDLVYMCEDLPPSNYLENGRLKGVSVEVLALIWKELKVEPQKIKVVPWARGYQAVLSEKNTVLFSMSKNKQREKLFKWVGPLFTVKSVLFGLSKNKIKIKTLNDAKKYRIGTIKNDITELFLYKNGFAGEKVEVVSNLKLNFDKLQSGRIDLVANSLDSFREYIKNEKLDPSAFQVVYVLEENYNYFAFNAKTPESLIQKFQKALDAVKKEHLETLEKYGISL